MEIFYGKKLLWLLQISYNCKILQVNVLFNYGLRLRLEGFPSITRKVCNHESFPSASTCVMDYHLNINCIQKPNIQR